MDNRIRNNTHRGYIMPHKEFMNDESIEYESLSEYLKSSIRLFEDKHDQYLNSEEYLDEKEESELLADSEKIKQDIEKWLSNDNNVDNSGKVATGVTLTLLGLFGLLIGINSLRD
jgi:Arc/MetJ-type ribon-helix-helix transcriptional regulator